MTSLVDRLSTIVRRVPPPLLGVGLMMNAALLSMMMSAIAKELVQELPVFEVVFFRQLFGTLMLAPLLFKPGPNPLRTRRIGTGADGNVIEAFAKPIRPALPL